MTNSRNKGAGAEREVAKLLFAELGISFSRDLRQYQKADYGDLLCDVDSWPFTIEVKRYAKGWTCKPAWETQVFKSAKAAGKHPCVIYRYDGQQWRVRLWIDAVGEALGVAPVAGVHFDTDIQGFSWIAREMMARAA